LLRNNRMILFLNIHPRNDGRDNLKCTHVKAVGDNLKCALRVLGS
jgi:hypothetical protein